MQPVNCLIIEDEPLAAQLLEDYIRQVPGLALKGICSDVLSASSKLREEKIDLLFLDINLPKINGLDFLRSAQSSYHVILTTAYHQYALEGYALDVTDYLLKPIEFSRFLQAVNKVFARGQKDRHETLPHRKHYFFNVDKKQVKVFIDEIVYIESLKDYVRIHTTSQKLITKFQLGEIEKLLASPAFIRSHKSYLVNKEKVKAYNATEIEVEGAILPIGRKYKEEVEAALRNR